jgi:hypothetical protein
VKTEHLSSILQGKMKQHRHGSCDTVQNLTVRTSDPRVPTNRALNTLFMAAPLRLVSISWDNSWIYGNKSGTYM